VHAPNPLQAANRTAWSRWLQRYGKRLAKEVAAGASNEERVRVQNATNPRCVLLRSRRVCLCV